MKKLVLLVLSSCLFITAMAQNPHKTITVKGILIDSASNTPLGYVTVSLINAVTKQPVKSMLAKDDGSFELANMPPRAYTLSMAYIGYKKKIIKISGKEAVTDVGKILMVPATSGLKEVTVNADKPLIKQEVDRISYDIQADPESKVLNVLDMLRKVPLVSLDADDNILLKGSGDYKILINGKPSSLMVHSPKDILRSMPASSIQKIEIITTPPAKYDSEGLAGIINIITNKKIDNGYNGSINLNERFPIGGPGLGGSFTFKSGKFGVASYYGGNLYDQPQTTYSNNRNTTGLGASNLVQSGFRKSNSHSGYVGTEFSYEIDTLNLITAEFNINGGNSNSSSTQVSNKTDSVLTAYNIANAGKGDYNGFDVGLNYQKEFEHHKDQLLTFNYKFTQANSNQFNDLGITDRINYPVLGNPDYQQNNKQISREQTIQTDYAQTVHSINIEAGLKGRIKNGDSNFGYDSLRYDPFNPGLTQYDLNPLRTNAYNNNQYILSAYNSYQYTFGNWGVKAGGRLEETIVNADFISTTSVVNQNYLNFIPSVSINRKFADMSNINLGFTQRVSRPDISNLNPFVDRTNPNFENAGNPNLKSVISNNFRLNYSRYKKGSINIGLSYSVASNTVQRISVFDPASGITRSTYDNIGKNRVLGSDFNINYPIAKNWYFNLNGDLNYIWVAGTVNGVPTKNSGIQGYFYAATGYKFTHGYRVNASMNFNSPYISLQGESNSYLYSSFSGSKVIVKNKLTLSASVSNPFNKYRTNINKTTGSNFMQVNHSQNYLRTYSVSLYYHFGKLKDAIRKNQRVIHNDDKTITNQQR